MFSEAQGTSE